MPLEQLSQMRNIAREIQRLNGVRDAVAALAAVRKSEAGSPYEERGRRAERSPPPQSPRAPSPLSVKSPGRVPRSRSASPVLLFPKARRPLLNPTAKAPPPRPAASGPTPHMRTADVDRVASGMLFRIIGADGNRVGDAKYKVEFRAGDSIRWTPQGNGGVTEKSDWHAIKGLLPQVEIQPRCDCVPWRVFAIKGVQGSAAVGGTLLLEAASDEDLRAAVAVVGYMLQRQLGLAPLTYEQLAEMQSRTKYAHDQSVPGGHPQRML